MEDIVSSGHLRALPLEDNHPDPVVEDLLRQLIVHLNEKTTVSSGGSTTSDGHDILLDTCLDGRNYTLASAAINAGRATIALSPRETEIVRMVARGLPTKAIADVLDVSLWTVSTHLRRVFAKLQVNSRAEMVARALHEGLI